MIRFRVKLFGFLLMTLFISHNGNAQSVNGFIDDSSVLVHFPLRDSLVNELKFLLKQQELKLKELDEELDFPPCPYVGGRQQYLEDTLALKKKVQEIQAYELETNRLLEEKSKEFGELIVSSFQSQFEAFCKQHPEKTIVFKSELNDCAECIDYTTDFVLFLEEKKKP